MKLQTKTYANLRLLGKVLVEKKGDPHTGQGELFPMGTGNIDRAFKMPPEKRKQLGVPRRRTKGAHPDIPGKRKGDIPRKKRPPGFKPDTHGERKADVSARAAKEAGELSRAATAKAVEKAHAKTRGAPAEVEQGRKVALGMSPEQLAVAGYYGRAAATTIKQAVRPIRFKKGKRRKQNPHTATSPID